MLLILALPLALAKTFTDTCGDEASLLQHKDQSEPCTMQGLDPYASGAFNQCCKGTSACLGQFDSSDPERHMYRCYSDSTCANLQASTGKLGGSPAPAPSRPGGSGSGSYGGASSYGGYSGSGSYGGYSGSGSRGGYSSGSGRGLGDGGSSGGSSGGKYGAEPCTMDSLDPYASGSFNDCCAGSSPCVGTFDSSDPSRHMYRCYDASTCSRKGGSSLLEAKAHEQK
eukprot:CAMPEP_0197621650 /NCGR_PEP_ID=MMETSP1338-20131121/2172_1 /TAXON_ID=43686 ORGANISM="Pelagodinium beii, Strain RCC1491" /NCGR_SAMPLE_ID=MMETSP1338 /ASSEMBLY_ACC=CAM_ASM_000754 /LENGTH=225 /DNA_ID=CAMNT_0043191171 /DNA_START=53 /DNA_END=730 /DNA_ORIENTATION=+